MSLIFLLGIILSIVFYNKLSYRQKNETPLGFLSLLIIATFGIAFVASFFGV